MYCWILLTSYDPNALESGLYVPVCRAVSGVSLQVRGARKERKSGFQLKRTCPPKAGNTEGRKGC